MPSYLRTPEDQQAASRLSEFLRTARDIASDMCGVPASGLQEPVVTIRPSTLELPGSGYAEVRGNALVEQPPYDDPSKSKAKVGRMVACTGVVLFFATAITNDADEVVDWTITSVSLSEVSTPGVEWTRPSSDIDWD
jgi:hypothetical protein